MAPNASRYGCRSASGVAVSRELPNGSSASKPTMAGRSASTARRSSTSPEGSANVDSVGLMPGAFQKRGPPRTPFRKPNDPVIPWRRRNRYGQWVSLLDHMTWTSLPLLKRAISLCQLHRLATLKDNGGWVLLPGRSGRPDDRVCGRTRGVLLDEHQTLTTHLHSPAYFGVHAAVTGSCRRCQHRPINGTHSRPTARREERDWKHQRPRPQGTPAPHPTSHVRTSLSRALRLHADGSPRRPEPAIIRCASRCP